MTIAGYLLLQGRFLRTWARRYFELAATDDGVVYLRCFASEQAQKAGKAPQSTRAVSGMQLLEDAAGAQPNRFKLALAGGGRTLSLAADTLEERDAWVHAATEQLGGGASGAEEEEEEEEEELTPEELARRAAHRLEVFTVRYGAAYVETARAAFSGGDGDGDGVLNTGGELVAALASLDFHPSPAELAVFVAAADEDDDGAIDVGEFVTLLMSVRDAAEATALRARVTAFESQRDAASTIVGACQSYLRGGGGMRAVVLRAQERMAQVAALLAQGFEVQKFPTSGAPRLRVLWLHAGHGALCLGKSRSDEHAGKAIPLECISVRSGCVVVGAAAVAGEGGGGKHFGATAKARAEVAGNEGACLSISSSSSSSGSSRGGGGGGGGGGGFGGGAEGACEAAEDGISDERSLQSFHIRVFDAETAELLGEKLRWIAEQLAAAAARGAGQGGNANASQRRALALHYAQTGGSFLGAELLAELGGEAFADAEAAASRAAIAHVLASARAQRGGGGAAGGADAAGSVAGGGAAAAEDDAAAEDAVVEEEGAGAPKRSSRWSLRSSNK
jgi:hypothetical protein